MGNNKNRSKLRALERQLKANPETTDPVLRARAAAIEDRNTRARQAKEAQTKEANKLENIVKESAEAETWGDLTFNPWLDIQKAVGQPPTPPAQSPSPPPPPPPQNNRPHAPSPPPPAAYSPTPPLPPQHSLRPTLPAHSPQAGPSPHLSAPILEPVISDSAAKTLEPGSGKLCLKDLIGYSSSSSSSPSPALPPSPSTQIGEPVVEPVIPGSALTQLGPDTGEVQGQESAPKKRKYMEIS